MLRLLCVSTLVVLAACSNKHDAVGIEDTDDTDFVDPDNDLDGFTESEDCDDNDPNTYPGAPELCDGVDNDCDGIIPATETDLDGDGVIECEEFCGTAPPAGSVNTLPSCTYVPAPSGTAFEAEVEWAMTHEMIDPSSGATIPAYTFAEFAESSSVFQTPMVGQMTDDTFDGVVNSEDTPDIAVIMNDVAESPGGVLRLISGDGRKVHDSISYETHTNNKGTHQYAPYRYAGLALGQADSDDSVEIFTLVRRLTDGQCYPAVYEVRQTNGLVELHLDRVYEGANYACGSHAPALADVDDDGVMEVIYGRNWMSADDLSWEAGGYGGKGWYGQGQYGADAYWNSGYHPFAYDLDGDGALMEIVAGSTVYNADGSEFCELGSYNASGTWTIARDGYPAVADFLRFPGDYVGEPEIVVTGNEYVSVFHGVPEYDPNGLDRCVMIDRLPNDPNLDPDLGTLPSHPNCDPARRAFGGQPTVSDFDADGDPDIGVAGSCWYSVYHFDESDGFLFKRYAMTQTKDWSSASTGSSVFDFNGDGQSQVVFSDEQALYVWELDPTPGLQPWDRLSEVLRDDNHKSWTIHEYPLVADLDNDGKAEILVTNAFLPGHEDVYGIYALGAANDDWVSARTVWSQHALYITNVEDDFVVGYCDPNYAPYTTADYNSFRQQAPGSFGALAAPNLFVTSEPACQEGCGDVTVYVQVANEGAYITAGNNVAVALYGVRTGPSGETRTLIDRRDLTSPLGPGELSAGLGFQVSGWSAYDHLVAVVDDPDPLNPWAWGAAHECDEADNETTIELSGLCP